MDKLKEQLKAQGFTDEQIVQILGEVTPLVEQEVKGLKDKNFELVGEKKVLTAKVTDLEKLTPLPPKKENEKKPESKLSESKPDPMLVELAESVKLLREQIQSTQQKSLKSTLVSKYLPDAKNPNLILSQLDMSKLSDDDGKIMITTDDGQQVEINTVFDRMRKSAETDFLFGKSATTVKKTTTVMGIEIDLDGGGTETAKIENPWAANTFNYTKQNDILAKSPELAAKMRETAKAEMKAAQGKQGSPPPTAMGIESKPMLVNPYE